jgi:hypothetical protein
MSKEINSSKNSDDEVKNVVKTFIYANQGKKINKMLSTLDYKTFYCLNLSIPFDSIDKVSRFQMKSLFKLSWALQRDKEISKGHIGTNNAPIGQNNFDNRDNLKLICLKNNYAIINNEDSMFFLKQIKGIWKIIYISESSIFIDLRECINEYQISDSLINVNKIGSVPCGTF